MKNNREESLFKTIILIPIIITTTIFISSYSYFTLIKRVKIEKDKLIIAWTQDAQTLDPIVASDSRSIELILNIYDRLIDYEEIETATGEKIISPIRFKPALAESWEILDEGRTYIFHLRKNVKFHNGDPVTAYAVKYSLTASLLRNPILSENILEINEIDNHTISIHLRKPSKIILNYLCHYTSSIVNPNQISETRGMTDIDAGSGPYKLISWEKNEKIVLEAVEDHYLKPKIKRIEIKIIDKISVIEAMIKTGETLGPVIFPQKDVELMKKDPNLKALEFETYSDVTYIVLNCKLYPLNYTKVRQALAWATPIRSIVEMTMEGYVTPANSIISKNALGYYPNVWNYKYNITKARELLAEVGLERGFRLTAYVPPGKEYFIHILAILQRAWSEIEVDLRIRKISESYYQRLLENGWMPITIYEWTSSIPDPTYKLLSIIHSKGKRNYAYYSNSMIDMLIERLYYTINKEEKIEILESIQKTLAKEVPYIPLFYPKTIIFIRKNLQGYIYYPDKMTRYWLLKIIES